MKTQFKNLLISRFLAALADQFMMFAVPIIVLKSTGSVAYSGLAFAIEWLPRLLFFPMSGTIADHVNVRKLYQFSDAVRFVLIVAGYGFYLLFPASSFLVLSIMMGLLAILNSLAFIGMEASFPKFVNPNEIPKIQSILQGIDQTSQVMGPAIAASASYFFPVHQLLIIGAILFAISSINMFFLGEKNKTKTISSTDIQTIENKLTIKKLFGSYQRAWLVLCARPILFQFSALTWILNVLYGATLVLVPAIALQVFNKPDHYLGLLQSITAVFSVLSFFLVPKLVEKFDLPGLGLISFSVALIGSFVISFAPNFLVLLIGAIIVHVPDGWFNVYIRSSRSLIIPKDDLGKTIGFIIIMNNGSLPLAGAIISRFSSHYSPQEIFFGFCIVSLVLTLITMMIGKKIFKYSTWMPNVSEVNA